MKKRLYKVIFTFLISFTFLPAAFAVFGDNATFTVIHNIGSGTFSDLASNSDGTKLVATVNGGQIYTSIDSGATWTARDVDRAWSSVASSSDGAKLVATVNGGKIYTSIDSGASWTERSIISGDGDRAWSSVASSSDGTKLVATVNNGDENGNGNIWASTDSGVSWSRSSSITPYSYVDVASSSDGTKLVAVVLDGNLLIKNSTTFYNWISKVSSKSWTSVASSSDGTKLVATVNGGQIYTSTNTGDTWVAMASDRGWTKVTSSSDGVVLYALAESKIWASFNSGANWRQIADTTDTNFNAIATPASGLALYALSDSPSNQFYKATNVETLPTIGTATIAGTTLVGQTLTATASTWDYFLCANGILSYQWQSSSDGSTNWTNISSATSTTFALTSSQANKYIRVQITPSTDCGSGSAATSSATAAVTGAPTIGSATIAGTTRVGQTLTATANSVTGVSVTTTYQWQSAATSTGSYADISSANERTFVLTSSEAGKYIKVKITVTNSAGSANKTSSATTVVTIAAPTIGSATYAGTTVVGQTLTATANTVTGTSVTTTYQWQSATELAGSYTDISLLASSSTFVLTSSEAGKYIKVKITVTNAGGTANTTSSATTAISKATPTISGFTTTEVLLSDGTYAITAPTANVPGTFSYSSSDSLTVSFSNASSSTATLVQLGSATITATFTPSDATGYNSNTATMVLTVSATRTSPVADSSDGPTIVTPVVVPAADYIFATTKSRRLATTTLVNRLNAQVKDSTQFIYNKNTKFSIFGTSKKVCKIEAGYLVPLKNGTCELWIKPTTLGKAGKKYWVRVVVKK